MGKWQDTEHRIEQELLGGSWRIGERLPSERSLAERFGVTRNTLRTALGALAARGILETRHGSGSVVRALPAGRAELGSIRERIEAAALILPPIAAACARSMTPTQVNRLEELLGSIGIALRAEDVKGFVRGGLDFFAAIASMSGNPCVEAAAACVFPCARSLYRAAASCSMQQREAQFALLARLLGALRRADPAEAEQGVQRYFQELSSVAEEHA